MRKLCPPPPRLCPSLSVSIYRYGPPHSCPLPFRPSLHPPCNYGVFCMCSYTSILCLSSPLLCPPFSIFTQLSIIRRLSLYGSDPFSLEMTHVELAIGYKCSLSSFLYLSPPGGENGSTSRLFKSFREAAGRLKCQTFRVNQSVVKH